MSTQARYPLLDLLRGLCVLSMIAYHAMYDWVVLSGHRILWYQHWQGYLWQQSICWVFFLLSGFCWGLSHHPLRHAAVVSAGGVLVTAVTCLFTPNERILCGVLTCLGLCAFLLGALQRCCVRFSKKLPPQLGLFLALFLFAVTRNLPDGSLGFEHLVLFQLPPQWYTFAPAAILGFPTKNFFSGDYYPLLPWFFLYLAGHFLRILTLQHPRAKHALAHPKHTHLLSPILWIGQNSLWVYLLHQPLLLAIFHVLPA